MLFKHSGLAQGMLLAILLAANLPIWAEENTAATILVLGDSLSGAYGINTGEGWVSLLQQKVTSSGANYRVINASVSGDTTRTGLTRIESALEEHQPAIVIIALGGNDGLRGLPFTEIKSSLAGIIERCQSGDAEVLLVGVRLPPNYGQAYTDGFAAIYSELSSQYNVALVPRILDDVADHRELLQEDGIHPKAEAQPRMMENVWRELQPMLESL